MNNDEYQLTKDTLPPHLAHQQQSGMWILNFSHLFVPGPNYFINPLSVKTKLDNLYLAGQYCKTVVALPTMEKACESGFRAASEICKKYNIPEKIKAPYDDFNHQYYTVQRITDSYLYRWSLYMTKNACHPQIWCKGGI
jgi:uncharacterized protein with NAD-binding domain and iron-sulfur cluster